MNRWITETNVKQTNPKLYKIILSLLLLASSADLPAQQNKKPEQTVQTIQTADTVKRAEITSENQLPVILPDSNINKMSTNVFLRGYPSISSCEQPLIIIDGVIYPNSVLTKIPAEKIKSLNVLKDASATAIYGARAAYGVIIIESKLSKREKKTFAS